jgi:RHS repeat-associated protein
MRRGAVNYFYHADDLHNVMAVTSGVGIVVERYEYQDYGQPEFFTGGGAPIGASAIGNPLLFTGRRYDQATGWYYFRSRYLDPLAGRFTTRDPIGIWGDAQSMGNGYTYAGSNPWSAVDPEGQGWLKRLRKSIKRIFEKPVKAVRKFTKQVGRIIKSVARLDAMLFGLKMIILDHLNGARHPARWNYGNHCGLTRKGFQPPKDEVDACCRDHDQCGHWSILTLGTVGSRRCNKNFCDCLREAHCYGNDKCRQYRKDARHLFCLWP